jgi:plastocyanin
VSRTLARMRAVLPLAAALLALSGCGEQRADATRTVPERVGPVPEPDPRAVATAAVSLVDYALDVEQVRVRRAGRISFEATNDGTVRHALAVDAPAGKVATDALRPGQRATFSIRLPPGTYKWYCPVADHEERGMAGRLRVAE